MGDYLQDTSDSNLLGSSNFNQNRSLSSSFASPSIHSVNTTSSSKAVLAALKALQDKIRRLETERSQALDEITSLKLQLKNQEIEYENAKQKEVLHNQRLIQENKLSYDHLVQEKNDLEQKLSKILDKNSSISELSNNLQMKIQMLEEDKQALIRKSKELENENSQLELQIKQSQLHEKDLAQSLASEARKNSQELLSLQTQLNTMEDQLEQSLLEKNALNHKLVELDALIEQLLTLNESLISQLSGKSFKFHSKVSKSKGSSNIPSIESIAAEASKILLKSLEKKGGSSGNRASVLTKNLESIEHMKLMHKIYSDIARKISRLSQESKKRHSSPGKKLKKSATIGDSDNEDNLASFRRSASGYDSATSTDKKTRIKMRNTTPSRVTSFVDSLHGQSFLTTASAASATPSKKKVKSALKRSSSNYSNVTNVTGDFTLSASPEFTSSKSSNHHEIRIPRPQTLTNTNTSFQGNHDTTDYLHTNQSPGFTDTSANKAPSKADMNVIIAQLEEEFNSLNAQYRNLLSNVSVKNPVSTINPQSTSESNIQNQAEEIVQVIQKLHEKGEQIRLLKSPTKV